jgi:hypothetical protein
MVRAARVPVSLLFTGCEPTGRFLIEAAELPRADH